MDLCSFVASCDIILTNYIEKTERPTPDRRRASSDSGHRLVCHHQSSLEGEKEKYFSSSDVDSQFKTNLYCLGLTLQLHLIFYPSNFKKITSERY